jgi:predicted RNase H-like nuclease (RuvC/YqgF family)
MFLKISVISLLMCLSAYGQSLGDIARENQEKKKAEGASGTPPKVITNQDLPTDAQTNPEPREPQPPTHAASRADDYSSAQQRLAEQRAAEQWKRQIRAQENKVMNLQARIDQLNASAHSVGGSAQYEGPYNRYQARQLQRVAQIQLQLDEQKRKLAEMQEEARHAGMHTAVYDP